MTQQMSRLPGLPVDLREPDERDVPTERTRRHRAQRSRPRGGAMLTGPERLRAIRQDRRSVVALVVVLVGLAGAIVIGLARDSLLPAKFSYDARFIQSLARAGRLDSVDRSFSSTAGLYRLLGLEDAPVAVGLITLAVVAVVTGIALTRRPDGRVPLLAGVLAAPTLVLGAVYLGTYSKDAPVLAVSAGLLLLRRSWRSELGILTVIAAYGWVFRSYWFLVLAVFVVLQVLHRLWPRWWVWILGAFAAIALIAGGIVLALHLPPDYFRSAVNGGRIGNADAQTMLRPLFDRPQPLAGLVSVMVTFLSLFVPVPLLQLGGPYYLAVFALVTFIWGCFWWAVVRTSRRRSGNPSWYRSVGFVVAFVTVQAFFEPDYGSALRHLTPLLPVIVFIVAHSFRERDAPMFVTSGFDERPQPLRGDTGVNRVRLAIRYDDRAGGDDAAVSDADARKDRGAGTDPNTVAD